MIGTVKGYSRKWRIGLIENSDGTRDVLFSGDAAEGGDGWLAPDVRVDYELDQEEAGRPIAKNVRRI